MKGKISLTDFLNQIGNGLSGSYSFPLSTNLGSIGMPNLSKMSQAMGFNVRQQAQLKSIFDIPEEGLTKCMVEEKLSLCIELSNTLDALHAKDPDKAAVKQKQSFFTMVKNDLDATLMALDHLPNEQPVGTEPRSKLIMYDKCFYPPEQIEQEKNKIRSRVQELQTKIEEGEIEEIEGCTVDGFVDIFIDTMMKGQNRVDTDRRLRAVGPLGYMNEVMQKIYTDHILSYTQNNIVARAEEWADAIRTDHSKLFPKAKKAYHKLKQKSYLRKLAGSFGDDILATVPHTKFGQTVLADVMASFSKEEGDTSIYANSFFTTYLALSPGQIKEIAAFYLYVTIGELLKEEQQEIEDKEKLLAKGEEERKKKMEARRAKQDSIAQPPVVKKETQKKVVPEYVTNFASLVCRGIKQKKAATENSVTRTVLNDYPLDVQAVYTKAGLSLDNSTYKIISQAADLNNIQIKEREEPKENSVRGKKEGSKKSKKRNKGKKGKKGVTK